MKCISEGKELKSSNDSILLICEVVYDFDLRVGCWWTVLCYQICTSRTGRRLFEELEEAMMGIYTMSMACENASILSILVQLAKHTRIRHDVM